VDSFDDAPDEARAWLRRELLRRLREEHLREIVVVVTTRDEVPHISDLRINDLLVSSEPVPLEAFEEEHVRAFMASRDMVEEPPDFTLKGILKLSGGVPGELARMANRVRAKETSTDDFFKDL
jgi:hypothetical protein